MLKKFLIAAIALTGGYLASTPDNADAAVRVYRGPNRSFVSVGRGYGYRGGRYYGGYGYGYGYPSYSYGYGYGYPSYGYYSTPTYYSPYYGGGYYGGGYYGGSYYGGGRRVIAGPNGFYYRGPGARVGIRY